MKRTRKYLRRGGFAVGVLVLLGAAAIQQRHWLIVTFVRSSPDLVDAIDEGPEAEWFDDYYTVQQLDTNVYVIGEPRYWQRNFNYLIIGEERALLIDAGPGVRDIRPVVESLTDLPYTLATTHFHFDHVGNGITFPSVAMVDLPHLRNRAQDDVVRVKALEHLGKTEGFQPPELVVDEWLSPAGTIDLGGLELEVIYTPGHTLESISFLDREHNLLFTGDWIAPVLGPFFQNSNMGDYLMATQTVLCVVADNTRVFSAHRLDTDPGGPPELTMRLVQETQDALIRIRSGDLGADTPYPASYQVNETVEMFAEPRFLQKWNPVYPELERDSCTYSATD